MHVRASFVFTCNYWFPMRLSNVKSWPFLFLCAAVFAMGISLPAARLFVVLAAVGLVFDRFMGREKFVLPPSAWALLALSAIACVVTYYGINPGKGFHKIHKLLWYIAIPVTASLVTSRERLVSVYHAALYGLSVSSFVVIVRNIISASATTRLMSIVSTNGLRFTFDDALVWLGTITDGQVMMVATVFTLALLMIHWKAHVTVEVGAAGNHRLSFNFVPLALAVSAMAEIVCLKRGSWAGVIVAAFIVAFKRVRACYVFIALVAMAALALSVPAVRNRIANSEFDSNADGGGRVAMWTRIAPQMIRERPWGSGFRCLTTERMREFCPQVEEGRDHLHSNFIEITMSLGFEGLCVYLLFLGLVISDCIRAGSLGLPVSAALVALMVNGFVEYSFADAEIILIFSILAGLAHSCARLERIR